MSGANDLVVIRMAVKEANKWKTFPNS
jgi:hypothetical protein